MNNLLKILLGRREPSSASTAKARLQIVLEEERVGRSAPDFLPKLQKELLEVVRRYYDLDEDMIRLRMERVGETSVLAINVDLDPTCLKTVTGASPMPGKKLRNDRRPALGGRSAS